MNAHSRNRRLNRNDPTDFYQLFFSVTIAIYGAVSSRNGCRHKTNNKHTTPLTTTTSCAAADSLYQNLDAYKYRTQNSKGQHHINPP